MQKCIVGKKIGMTQLFDENGKVIPVTVVEAGPCVVVQKKTIENDGYEAVQIGYGDISDKAINKPLKGHFAKADVAQKRTLKEFRLEDCSSLNVGDIIKADAFAAGDAVDVAAPRRARATPAPSSGSATTPSKRPTAPAPSDATPAPTAPARPRPASLRARASRATWVTNTSPSRTLRSSRWTRKTISSRSEVRSPAPRAAWSASPIASRRKGRRTHTMPKVQVYDMAGKAVSEIELSDAVFGITPNQAVVHACVVNYLANQRQGTQSTLTRTEVTGGGRKPWRQKGTGHARQGSIRAPQWRKGGIALGPKPRDYSYSLNKKTRRLAIKSVFSDKVLTNDLIVVDQITVDGYKTRPVVDMLKALGAEKKALIVMGDKNDQFIKSASNIPGRQDRAGQHAQRLRHRQLRQVHRRERRRRQTRGGVRIMKAPQDIILRPVITEASMANVQLRKYTFRSPRTPTRLKSPRPSRRCSPAPRCRRSTRSAAAAA